MLRKLGIVVGVLLAAVLVAMITRPDSYRVERSITIDAPPDVVFAYVNDFREWPKWSPFEKLDPTMQRRYGGAANGAGATYAWTGNSQAGAGRMEITESVPGERVALDLHFTAPVPSSAKTEFTFVPAANGTTVTWAMSGGATMMTRALEVVSSMDAMLGPDFESGLAALKRVSEAGSARPAPRGDAP